MATYGTYSSDSTNAVWNGWATIRIDSGTVSTSATITTSATNNEIWYSWSGDMTGAVIQAQPHIPVPLTPEQIEEEQRQAETWRAQQAERERVQVEADATALELLESTLTPQQREDFLKDNAFFVVSKSGKVYQIRKGRQQNIYEMDANRKLVKKYCVVPQESDIPTGDILLMQKLLIEHAEDEFLRKANSWAM